jgi:hypothetical protein
MAAGIAVEAEESMDQDTARRKISDLALDETGGQRVLRSRSVKVGTPAPRE